VSIILRILIPLLLRSSPLLRSRGIRKARDFTRILLVAKEEFPQVRDLMRELLFQVRELMRDLLLAILLATMRVKFRFLHTL